MVGGLRSGGQQSGGGAVFGKGGQQLVEGAGVVFVLSD